MPLVKSLLKSPKAHYSSRLIGYCSHNETSTALNETKSSDNNREKNSRTLALKVDHLLANKLSQRCCAGVRKMWNIFRVNKAGDTRERPVLIHLELVLVIASMSSKRH